jgi:hypothetical protein
MGERRSMPYRRFPAFVLVLAMAAAVMKLAACGGSPSSSESFVVGPGGGTFTADGVVLTVPSGAVGEAVTITVVDDPAGAPSGFTVDGKIYRFAPEGLTFSVPVTVSFPTQSTSESVFWTVAGSQTEFAPLTTTVDGARATAQVTHFSSGFVGVAGGAVTCTTTRRNDATCATTTTVETPGFAFTAPPSNPFGDPRGALTCNSQGLHDLALGSIVLIGNPDHTEYTWGPFWWWADATVSGTVITSFTADGARQGNTTLIDCVNPPPLIEVHCRGGASVHVDAGVPPVDSGATDSGSPLDASTVDSGDDCPVWDGGVRTTLATVPVVAGPAGPDGPIAIAVKGGFAYYTTRGPTVSAATGTVMRVPITGGTPTPLAQAQAWPVALTVDDTSIYWANAGLPTGQFNGAVMSMSLDGGPPSTLASNQNNPEVIAVNGTSIVWGTDSRLMKAALDGGSPSVLMTPGAYFGLTLNATTAFFSFGSTGTPSPSIEKVGSVGLDGTGAATVAANQDSPRGIANDGTSLYWTGARTSTPTDGGLTVGATDGGIFTSALDGGGIKPLASHLNVPYRVAVDRCYVYWSDHDGIAKASVHGGPTIRLASLVSPSLLGAPPGIAIDDTSIYWTMDSGEVYRLVPK